MNKPYKAHPLMIFNFIKPFLFVLVIPLFSALLRYLTERKSSNILTAEIFIFIIIMIIGVLRYHAFRLILSEDYLTIRSGILFMRTSRIRISKISSVQTEYTPLDSVFRSITYCVNTEAGSFKKSDFKFKLRKCDSIEISKYLYADKTVSRVQFSAIKVAVMAAATSSAATGIFIGVPVIRRTGKLLGIGIEKLLFDEINTVSNKFQTYFPPVVNTVTAVILLAYTVSFIYSFIKHINFKLSFGEESLMVHSGFFVRFKTAFKRSRINNIKLEQTLLMRLIKRYSMKVSVGGFDDAKSVSQVIVPSGKREQILNDFAEYFPFVRECESPVCPRRSLSVKSRFLFLPGVYLILSILLSTLAAHFFPDFGRLILFVTLIIFSVIFCFASACIFEYRHGSVKFGENIFAKSNRRFGTCEFYCPKNNIGEIKLTRFPLDVKQGLCRARLTVCSENADSIRIRFIDYGKTTAEISKCFNLGDYFN